MGQIYLNIPFVGEVSVEHPCATYGQQFLFGALNPNNGFELWAGKLHVIYDPPRRSPAWLLLPLVVLACLMVPPEWAFQGPAANLRELVGTTPHRPITHAEFAQVCAEWPALTMCKAEGKLAVTNR